MSFFRSVIGVLLPLAFTPFALGQSLATVQGFVSDDTGAALPGVSLELANLERGQGRSAVTNREGFFAVRAVPAGEYDLIASLAGFRTARRERIRLHVGQVVEVDLQLSLASVEETVMVTAEAPVARVSVEAGPPAMWSRRRSRRCRSRAGISSSSRC